MVRTKHIRVSDNFVNVLNYSLKQIMRNAKMDKLPSMPKATRLIAEETIIDNNTIIFRIPNGNPNTLKERLKSYT